MAGRWIDLPVEVLCMITQYCDRVTLCMIACAQGCQIRIGAKFVQDAAACSYLGIVIKYGHEWPYYARMGAAKGSQMHIMEWALRNCPCDRTSMIDAIQHVCVWSTHAMWSEMMWRYGRKYPANLFTWIHMRIRRGMDFEIGKTFPVKIDAIRACRAFDGIVITNHQYMTRIYDWLRLHVSSDVMWRVVCAIDNVDLYQHAVLCEKESPPYFWRWNINAYLNPI